MSRNKILYLLLAIVLLYGFFIRLNYLGNSFRFADAYRDYLVSRNIVRENKLNLIGPHNGAFATFSSPVYFYLIAGVLKINQSMLFLEFILVLLQLASIYTVFLIGKNLFSTEGGLIAATLYSFIRVILQQSNFIWQPNLMQPIFIFSLFFLVKSYKSKSFKYFVFSVVLVSLAITLFNSVLGMIVLLLISFYLIFRKNNWGISRAVFALLMACFFFLLFYLPPIIYHISNQKSIVSKMTQNLEPTTFLERLPQNLKYLVHLNGYHMSGVKETSIVYQDLLSNVLSLVIVILSILYLNDKKSSMNNKLKLLLLILFIVSPVILASFSKSFIQPRHFFLSLVPLSLLLGEVISGKLKNTPILLLGKLLLVILLLKGFMLHPSDFNLLSKVNEPQGQLSEEMFRQLHTDITKTKGDYNLGDFNFFQFNIFPNTPHVNGWSDAEFWVKLEDSFNIKFTKNDDSSLYLAYRSVNSNKFIYLVCDIRILGSKPIDICLNDFLQTSGYQYVRKVAQDSLMSVFLTKKPS